MMNQTTVNGVLNMARGTFRLKSRELIEKYGGTDSLYRIAKDGDVNYTTILRWKNEPESVQAVKLDVLFSFLVGLGLTVDQIDSMPLGELFDVLSDDIAAQ